jgi:anthranilate synthase component 2
MITVVDNYDSFTYNLVQQIERISAFELQVVRNDRFDVDALLDQEPEAIVISPGPGTPARAGRILELIRSNESIPLLGICLGHQAIGEAFGARIVRGRVPVHGKLSDHSLVVDRESMPDDLRIDAETDDGVVMAIAHRDRPIYGIQFHPESYGTEGGDKLIANFLAEVRQ